MNQVCCNPAIHSSKSVSPIKAIKYIEPANSSIKNELKMKLVKIPKGSFNMGAPKSTYPEDFDSPQQRVAVGDFLISPFAVSNQEYARFVEASGYCTIAEREGWSFVFHQFLQEPVQHQHPPGLPWWRIVNGAFWAAPEGPTSSIAGRENHPVVHISWYDAVAYCRWAGLRLPHEVEWERAARGGIENAKFPWGNQFMPNDKHAMNTWQGEFPHTNMAEDGYKGTAPVDAYSSNDYGLYNMTGNVWEWADNLFSPSSQPGVNQAQPRVQRGGSYLCHLSYCDRYHVHSRTQGEPDSSTGHSGFRVAADIEYGTF